MSPNISDRGVERKSSKLDGKQIAIGVCGGIGAVEIVKIIRELRRHGGEVTAFMTPGACEFITPLSVEWAARRPAVLKPEADVSHLENYDLVLIAPATLSTIAKSVLALTDNVVSLLIASQLGKRGALGFVPTMNASLYKHPQYQAYTAQLKAWGAKILEVPPEEDRLKMPAPETITEFVFSQLLGNS